MKRYIAFAILLLCKLSGYAERFDSPVFQVEQKSTFEISNTYRDIILSTDTSILLNYNKPISGLAISGKTTLDEDKNAIVRIILIDKNGTEYLVFEDFHMFPYEDEHVFTNFAIETAVLENIIPVEVKIFLNKAHLEISQIVAVSEETRISPQELKLKRRNILAAQEEFLIDKWNSLNRETKQYWVAGKTSISSLPYAEKRNILGATSNYFLSDGLEYYVGGFFVVKDHNSTSLDTSQQDKEIRDITPAYVENFDWRNRHGKNWMTSVKNQKVPLNNEHGNNGCWAFGSLAALESHINLYYNRLLNLDLSEQELGSCSAGSLQTGGFAYQAYSYILNNGITSEQCFPFLNDATIPCNDKCTDPEYIVTISGHSVCSNSTNTLKGELIQHGPIASGYCNYYTCHLMCLCGYGTITEGTHIEYVPQTPSPNIDTIIPANSNLIGKTYWIYKNSFGLNSGINGYLYAVYENDNTRDFTEALSYPVALSTLTTEDIVCEDADNDGYYFWGLGPKPNNCPVCCPDTPDGDDSDPELAEMDTYGNFAPYTFPYSTTTISSNTAWNSDTTHCGNIIVTNNAIFTITEQLTMNPAAKIIVQNGGTLIVDAGSIVNATVDVQASAKLQLLHNGTLYLKQFGNLNVELGAEADMEYGRVLLQ